jgi:hypothetical protein
MLSAKTMNFDGLFNPARAAKCFRYLITLLALASTCSSSMRARLAERGDAPRIPIREMFPVGCAWAREQEAKS